MTSPTMQVSVLGPAANRSVGDERQQQTPSRRKPLAKGARPPAAEETEDEQTPAATPVAPGRLDVVA